MDVVANAHLLHYVSSELMSSYNRLVLLKLPTDFINFVSRQSVNECDTALGKSLILMDNNGPKMLPWRTPDLTGRQEDIGPPKDTNFCLFER